MKIFLSILGLMGLYVYAAVAQSDMPEWFVLGNRGNLVEDTVSQEENVSVPSIDSEKIFFNYGFEDKLRFANNNKDLELTEKWLKKEFATEKTRNIVLSPLDFYVSSVLLANGVVDQTLFEFSKIFSVMRLAEVNQQVKSYIMRRNGSTSIQLSLWGKFFSSHFSELMKKQLNAEIWGLNDTTKVINDWIKAKTYGKIDNIITVEPVKEADIFLASSAYFEAPWRQPFTDKSVVKQNFRNLNGRETEIEMLHEEMEADYFENETMVALRLFYDTGDYISLFMPKNESNFENFVTDMTSSAFKPDFEKKSVDIMLPKMEIEYQSGMIKDVYKMLGVQKIFEKGNYEFAKMISFDEANFIKDVLLKAKIKLDDGRIPDRPEEETKLTANLSEKATFYANRPFVFLINNGDFVGVVVKAD